MSADLFELLCGSDGAPPTVSSMGKISRFGGPILYLVLYAAVLFMILVFVDLGKLNPVNKGFLAIKAAIAGRTDKDTSLPPPDVIAEAQAVESSDDLLRVVHVSKSFDHSKPPVVDDVSFGAAKDTVVGLLGPNGAGTLPPRGCTASAEEF